MSEGQITNESANNNGEPSTPAVDYGMFLLAIPAVTTMLIWFWVGSMNLFQKPGDTLTLLLLATVIGTAIVAGMEANKLGMVTNREKGSYSSTSWFFIISLLWFVGYPAYLFKRKDYGLTNRLVAGIAITVIFVGSYTIMSSALDNKIQDVRSKFGLTQQHAQKHTPRYAEPLNSAQKDRRAITSYLEFIKIHMEGFYADNERYPSAKELRSIPEVQEYLNKLLAISEVSVDSSNASYTYTIIAKSIKNPKVVVRVSP